MSNTGRKSEAAPDPWGRGWAVWSHWLREEGNPYEIPVWRGPGQPQLLPARCLWELWVGNRPSWGGRGGGEGFSLVFVLWRWLCRSMNSSVSVVPLRAGCPSAVVPPWVCFTCVLVTPQSANCAVCQQRGRFFFGEVWSCNVGTSIWFCVCFLGGAPAELFSCE